MMIRSIFTLLRRAIVAMFAGLAVTAAVRMRSKGGVKTQTGGWRELTADELVD